MAPVRSFSLYASRDQWRRASHEATAIDPETGGVQLAFAPDAAAAAPSEAPARPSGLAFDSACRLYHSAPAEGRVERVLWRAQDPLAPAADRPASLDLFEGPSTVAGGGFAPAAPEPGPLRGPRGLAVDADDHLYIAETGARRVVVVDLASGQVIRRVGFSRRGAPATPVDLAAVGRDVWVLTQPFGLLRMAARSGPGVVEIRDPRGQLPVGIELRRLAASPDGDLVLLGGAAGISSVITLRVGEHLDDTGRLRRGYTVDTVRPVGDATDLEFQELGLLVVARQPGEDLLRFRGGDPDVPLKAKAYDGGGIVRTPDGRIAFWTDHGVRHAVNARVRHVARGTVSTYALDGHDHQQTWGRMFLDACVPHGTEIRVHAATSDELPELEPVLPHRPAAGDLDPIPFPERTPPLVPLTLRPRADEPGHPIHRRGDGRELPWVPAAGDPFATFDIPVHAPRGRYLWLRFDLAGDGRATPRIRSVRIERPGHDLMRRLPRIYSRDEPAEAFLRRYLATVDGLLIGLADRSAERRSLIDPASTPPELLPWLAAFVGLVLDERWPLHRRRALIAEAVWLFRFRGTVPGLLRFVEICLGMRPIIVEQFRLRGLGGAVLREATDPVPSSPVVGGGFRIGGAVGEASASVTTASAFASSAHRFALLVPADLSDEHFAATADVLEVHRPAHTLVEICPVGVTSRVGAGLHIGLSSVIGRSSGWDRIQLGQTTLGTTALLGRARDGIAAGTAALGRDTRLA